MSGAYCFNGCDCDECAATVTGTCGCFTGVGYYHRTITAAAVVACTGNQPPEDV